MRGIVIAKMLALTLWSIYLAIGLTQSTPDSNSANRVTATIRHP
jgi:hypothetical protein